MTTTATDTAQPAADDPAKCAKCGGQGKQVPDTDPPIYKHDSCGATWGGDPAPDADKVASDAGPPANAVQADDVTGPGERTRGTSVEQHVDRPDFDEAMSTLPAIPTRTEWTDLAMQARMLSLSPLAPKILRGNPWACMDLAMTGRALGIDVHTAADLIDIIPDAGEDYSNPRHGRKSPSPELINARIQQLGLGSIMPLGRSARHCVAVALLPGGAIGQACSRLGRHFNGSPADWKELGWTDGIPDDKPANIACACHGILGHSEFTWDMAREAGLVQGDGNDYGNDHEACQPGAHKPYVHTTSGKSWTKCDCRTGYITYPERMMWWRAAGFCADDYFPAAGLGLYSPDALGMPVDADGRLIDPGTIELPEGFEPVTPPHLLPADPHVIAHLQARIAELPDDAKAELRQRWDEKQRDERVHPVRGLLAGEVALASSLVNGAVAKARGKDWKPEVPADAAQWKPAPPAADPAPATDAPAAQGDAPAPDGAPPAPDAQDATQAPAAAQPAADPTSRPTEPSEQALTLAIAQVQPMTARELNGKLRDRAMSDKGNEADRRRALGFAIAMELTLAAWDDQQRAKDAGGDQ